MEEGAKINLPHFEFTQDKNGGWDYKTLIPQPKHKSVHGEKPQFPVVEELEEHYSRELQRHLDHAMSDVRRYLNV